MAGLLDALRHLAHQHGIAEIYTFGSRAQEVASRVRGETAEVRNPGSDIDIGVRPRPGVRLPPSHRVQLTIDLEDLLRADRVDLVVVSEAPAFLALEVARGELVYCEDEDAQAEYELFVLRRAGDLAPFERQRREMILEGGGR